MLPHVSIRIQHIQGECIRGKQRQPEIITTPEAPKGHPVIPSGYPLHRPPTHPPVSQYQYAHLPQQPQQMYQPAPYDPTAYERARTNLPSHRPSPRAASRSRPRSQPRSPASSHYPSPPQRYFSISSAESPPQRRVHTNTSHHDPSSPETYEQPLDRQTTAYRSMSNETTETCAPINPIIPTPSPGPSTPQVQGPLQGEASKGWSHGLCDPSGDCGTCCLGLFCPCVLFGRVQHRLRLKKMHQDSTNLNEKEIREREKGHSRLVTTQPQAIGPMSYPGGLG
ncbi:hypothetical protein KEM55_009105 [Ascosphaera atra]|nr:hypothetical protein KEM55_009105 [Ascosphaera atra]